MTINIDYDFTVVIPSHPEIDIGSERVLKLLIDKGHQLILFTCRSNKPFKCPDGKIDYNGLDQAIQWFKDRNIPLYGIQRNPSQDEFTSSPKSFADLMIDDTALGIPLIKNKKLSDRPFVDWEWVEQMLEVKGLI